MEEAPRPPVRADILISVFIKVGQVKVQSDTHPSQETIYGRLFAITSSAYNDTSAQPQTSQWGQPAEIPVEVRVL